MAPKLLYLILRRLLRPAAPRLTLSSDSRIRALEERIRELEERNGELEVKVLVLEKEVQILKHKHPRPKLGIWDKILLTTLIRELPRADWKVFFFSPATLIRWHKEAVARKWTFRHRRGPGRPPIDPEVAALICRMARENASWGYPRIKGECLKLGIRVSPTSIKKVLRQAGIPPAPRRQGPSWSEFIRSQAEWIYSCDFFTVETAFLRTLYVFFFVHVGTRRLRIVGVTSNPDGDWVTQCARNLFLQGDLDNVRFLIRDRDSKFTRSFDEVFRSEGARVIKAPIRSPKANAFAERVVGTIRREVTDRMLLLGRRHTLWVMRRFERHYNEGRPHRGLELRPPAQVANGARLPDASAPVPKIRRKDVLGGLIHEYEAVAA